MAKNYPKHPTKQLTVSEVVEKYDVTPDNPHSMVGKAQNGLSVTAFFDFQNITGFSSSSLAEILNLSFKTIQRYQNEGKKLNALNSEQLLKMIAMYKKAEDVFGSPEDFNRWLQKPSYGLGIDLPFDLLKTSGGIDLIYDELCRIEHGSLA